MLTVVVVVIAGSTDQLHKGVLHFNRHKLRHQAAMLLRRQNKFKKLLPAAREKLAAAFKCLDRTPEADKPALVQSMRAALQTLARGACCPALYMALVLIAKAEKQKLRKCSCQRSLLCPYPPPQHTHLTHTHTQHTHTLSPPHTHTHAHTHCVTVLVCRRGQQAP